MNAFSTAAALTVLAATTVVSAAQTQEQPSLRSEIDAKSGATSCQLRREAMKGVASSTAFAATAAQDGVVEVALASLALRKSEDSQLRQLALKIVQDYAESNEGLGSIVKCEGLILPVELDAKHSAVIRRLDAKSGKAFEKAYLGHILEQPSEATALFKAASLSGDPYMAAFAWKSLSMLKEHQLLAADNVRVVIGTSVASTH